MYEKGSTICLNFTIRDAQMTNVIKKDYSNICVSISENIPPNVTPWGNKTINCSITENMMSMCFGDFQLQDGGLFFLCDATSVNSKCYANITLKIIVSVHNVSLIPSKNQLTVREGIQKVIQCVVNSDADPAPTITWYLGSSDITSRAGTDTTSITLTGNRTDSGKTLQCRATNDNKPPKIGNTTLNVEYPPMVNTLSRQDIIEGRDFSVTCQAILGNPSSTTFYWTKVDNPGFRQIGSTLQLYNIQRTSYGTYRCTAENIYSNGEKGSGSQSLAINVIYPPLVNTLSNQNIIEGRNLSVTCTATPGNPSSTVLYWTKVDNPGFRQNGAILQLYTIQRSNSGTYRCTAENNYYNGERGTHSQTMVVNVLSINIHIYEEQICGRTSVNNHSPKLPTAYM